ncbi:hypothetical protein JTB14_019530 [Gonioctena quinquepunctata]|nr:hypothetical protein JTB14_019530 [Gonioctena quinquepunctata]
MSSDSECSESEVGEQSTNFRFVEALVNHKVLFNKSRLPANKKARENALIIMQESYQVLFGKNWDKKLLEIIDDNVQNPVFHKIPGAVSMGIAGKQHLPDDNNTDVPPLPPMPAPRPIPPPTKTKT